MWFTSKKLKSKLCHKNWTYRKDSLKLERHPCKRFTIKDQESNCGIPLDLRKRPSEIRENFVSDPHLNKGLLFKKHFPNTVYCQTLFRILFQIWERCIVGDFGTV